MTKKYQVDNPIREEPEQFEIKEVDTDDKTMQPEGTRFKVEYDTATIMPPSVVEQQRSAEKEDHQPYTLHEEPIPKDE